ncbi:DUF222 domain-containing protein [Rhodococcus sp. NPDC054953]
MFESGGSGQAGVTSMDPSTETEAPGILSGVPDIEWTAVLRDRHAGIARAQFLEVDAVASVYLARCADDARRGCNEAFQGEFAHVEVGVMLTVTEPVARRWIGLGLDLRWRLHATSEAFASGRIDQARAQAISDAMANVSADKVELVEQLLLNGIDGATTSMIRRAARRLIARHDPEGTKARREQREADRDMRFYANDDGTCTVEGTLPGPAGQLVAMRLRKMSFDVCAGDPRTLAQRRADALVALADGSGWLRCLCGRADCAQLGSSQPKQDGPRPDGPRPDGPAAATASDSARVASNDHDGADGESSVCAAADDAGVGACADGDAADGGDAYRGAADGGGARSGGARGAGAVETVVDDRSGAAMRPLPPTTIHVGVNLTTLLGLDDLPGFLAGHGWIDADLARDLAADGTWRKVLTLTDADREALLDALCGHTGHGGAPGNETEDDRSDGAWLSKRRSGTLPHGTILGVGRALSAAGITPAAIREHSQRRRDQLTYRPTHRLAEIVRARDGGCRFPGCGVRAAACDIDHTVPFDHTNPESGGWTVEQNLACLCRRHHRLKTIGRWTVRQIGSGRLEWTSPARELVITEPAGEFSTDDTDHRVEAGIADRGEPGWNEPAFDESDSGEPDSSDSASSGAGPETTLVGAASDAEIAERLGVTLTDRDTIARLFDPSHGRGVEADLAYILDCHPAAPPVDGHPGSAEATSGDGSGTCAVGDEPPPF